MIRLRAIFLAFAMSVGATGLSAESAATDAALLASDNLRAAISRLDRANSAADRVAALTETIRAYETGLAAMRDSLRGAARREAQLQAAFDAQSVQISQLLGAMAVMGQSRGPLLTLHPGGPEAAVRSGMILSDVTPAIQAEADRLRGDLEEIALLRTLQVHALVQVQTGLASVQRARVALSEAAQDRSDLPPRLTEQSDALRDLVQNADTLEGFAAGLTSLPSGAPLPSGDFLAMRGQLTLPATGTVLRRAGEADAAGITRPGIVLETPPAAVVTAPWSATIRYRGALLDYENVMVIEPAEGYLIVLAGLGTVYGEVGDVISAGAPLGLMTGTEPPAAQFGVAFVAEATEESSAPLVETLYIEVRQGTEPEDPADWFNLAQPN